MAEVLELFTQKGIANPEGEAEKFINFYESKNWMVGKTKMCKWRSAAANWAANAPKEDQEWGLS